MIAAALMRAPLAGARSAGRVLDLALVGFAALAGASWALSAAAHADDAYGVDHVAGTWLALARLAGEGTLYPPIYDGESFGGTRYMPIPILLQGGLGRLFGDYLVAGKTIAYTATLALLVLVVVVLRRQRCSLPVALMLASTLLVTGTGVTASTWIRHDTLPVVLQLLAIALVARSTTRRALVFAALLCALALSAKLAAIWAPLAIGIWLLVHERSRLAVFAAAFVGATTAALGAFEAVTRGRLTENVVELGLAGSRGFESLGWEESRIRLILGEGLGPARLLVILALVVVVAAAWRRRLTLYELAFAVSLPILAVVLADRGTSANQLLDLQVLTVAVLGGAWARSSSSIRTGLTLVVLATAVASYVQNVEPVQAADALLHGGTSRVPAIAMRLDPAMRLLSEDPYVPVALGQRPIVLDPFMLWAVAKRDATVRADLVRRLDDREFDAVVLFYRPEDRSRSELVRFWFETEHFGTPIVDAIERNYRASESVDGRWIYVRRQPATVADPPIREP